MTYQVSPGNLFGRIGTGIGKGLAENVPREIERYRLSEGLKQFEKDAPNLNPTEKLARLYSIPGMTPQMQQSFGQLAMQQERGRSLQQIQEQQDRPIPNPFTDQQSSAKAASSTPSIPKASDLAEIQKGYIPPTKQQEHARAGQLYNESPQRFANDPQKAIDFVAEETARNNEIAQAYQTRHENLSRLQENVVSGLQNHSKGLGVEIPANIYSRIEDEAIQATKPISEGGQGLTEQQAKKEYGKKLDEISRDYKSLASLGDSSMIGKKPKDILNTISNLSKKFAERGDSENLADKLTAKTKLSPSKAFAMAYPVSNNAQLQSMLKKLPQVQNLSQTQAETQRILDKTLEISQQLAPFLKKDPNVSPLSIGYELKKKGYDHSIWMKYINDHKQELDLKASQDRQLDKLDSFLGTFNDWWLNAFSGTE